MEKDQLIEAQKGIADMILEPVTKQVMETVKAELPNMLPQQVDMQGPEDRQKKLKTEAVDYMKSLFSQKAVYANTGTATEGAELAPEYYASELIRIAENYGLARQKCRRVPLPGKKVSWPTGGGVTASKVNQGSAISAQKPTTGQVYMEPEKLGLIIPVSKELLEDTNIDLVNYLNRIAAEAFAKLEDAMLLGTTGSSSGEGMLKKDGVPVLALTGTAFSDISFNDLLTLQGKLDPEVRDGGEYIFSHYIRDLLRLKQFSIGSDKLNYQWGSPLETPKVIWDRPYNVHRSMPGLSASAADTKFIAYGNFDYAMFGDRRMYTVERSDVATITGTNGSTLINLWEQDMVGFKFTERIDIELFEHTKAFATIKTAAAGS